MADQKDPVAVTATPAVNGTLPDQPPATKPAPQKKKPGKRKPNYALLHSKPLPLEIHPLPAFHPSHPLSLLRLAYAYLSQIISPPTSHLTRYTGYFSSETRSVHITDPKHVRALWEMGFFGKGILSRSEPSWLDREKAKVKDARGGGAARSAEENTKARREQRRLFKLERARVEAERIEKQRLVEEGKLPPEALLAVEPEVEQTAEANGSVEPKNENPNTSNSVPEAQTTPVPNTPSKQPTTEITPPDDDDLEEEEPNITNQEHLQLTLEEAFFLSYGLDALEIHPSSTSLTASQPPSSTTTLLSLFTTHALYPPTPSLAPDNQFLLNYVVYHHFRSLGWVVRPGVKFSCDYLLYNRGPVFSHAEFAIIIIPSYTHAYWKTERGMGERRLKGERDWWWLHCVNRVQSQVRKTLVLVYVDIPPPEAVRAEGGEVDVGALLRGYRVREFVVRRWLANRSRD